MYKKKYLIFIILVMLVLLSSCDTTVPIKNIKSVESLPIIEVQRGTLFEELTLSNKVVITLEDDTTVDLEIDWSSASDMFDSTSDSNTLEGSIILNEFVTNTEKIKVTQIITFTAISILDTLELIDSYSIFYEALVTSTVLESLDFVENTYTIFVPTNEAFIEALLLLEMTKEELLDDEILNEIVSNHIVMGNYSNPILRASSPTTLTNIESNELTITLDGNTLLVNDTAEVSSTMYEVTKGVIHELDTVLIPIKEDSAGEELFDDELFSAFTSALLGSGIIFELLSQDSVTVFIPNEAAFLEVAETYSITVEDILDIDKIDDLLLNHIVSGEYLAEDLYTGAPSTLRSLSDKTLQVEVVDGALMIAGSMVISSEINDRFGIIYTVDHVFLTEEIITILEELSNSIN